jgi:hypothetical protein
MLCLVMCNLHLTCVGILKGAFLLFLTCCRVDHIYWNQIMLYEYYIGYSLTLLINEGRGIYLLYGIECGYYLHFSLLSKIIMEA